MKKMFSTVEAYKAMNLEEAADRKVLKFLGDFRKFYAELKKVDSNGYAVSKDRDQTLWNIYLETIENHISKKDRKGIPGLDGKKFDHAVD